RSWCLLEQRHRGHDLPRLAIAALRNIELDPRQLHRVLSICGKPLDRGDVLAGNGSNRIAAGPDGLTVDQHCAGATLRDTAAEFRSLELEGIAQHPQQLLVRLHVELLRDAVHDDGDCHSLLPVCDQLSANGTSRLGCTTRRLSAAVPLTSPPFSRMLDPMPALLKRDQPFAAFFHHIMLAMPIMTRTPDTLTASWVAIPPDNSTIRKWARNERTTPTQKIASECCPVRIAGRKIHDRKRFQSAGSRRTISTISAMKCVSRT